MQYTKVIMLYLSIGALMITTKSQTCETDDDCYGAYDPVCYDHPTSTNNWCTQCQVNLDCSTYSYYANRGELLCKISSNDGSGDCVECLEDYDCSTGYECNTLNKCVASLDTNTDTDTDTDEDECTTDSDCVTLYGSGASCKSSTTNYCLIDAKTCSTNSDCIAQACTSHKGYYNYCADILCTTDSFCSSTLSDDTILCTVNDAFSITPGTCYQGCSSDDDCGATNYECNTSSGQCAYIAGSSTASSSGVDQFTVFMAIMATIMGYALLM